ncbi:MAG TPA: hypothetical protein VFQ34_06110 [Nitrospiraceae bacterium]|jgi:hypothetical protein|nr:hypothetical protein [Nitrospiraceae bacterium]
MTTLVPPHQRSARPAWHAFFAQAVLYLLAPVLFLSSGFFTANFVVSGHYSWPRTSRLFVLSVTLFILAYEFVYKEQAARAGVPDRGLQAVLYACVLPYAVGVLMMLGLAKL